MSDNPVSDHPVSDIAAIDIERAAGELRLRWEDGFSGSLNLMELRLACPCAGCRGTRDAGGQPWPGRNSPQPLDVTGAEVTGAWGLAITWNDGHNTGIYPFAAMRAWVEAGSVEIVGDSGLGGFSGES